MKKRQGLPKIHRRASEFEVTGPSRLAACRLRHLALPNVRVKPAPTVGRAGSAGENVSRTAGRARASHRWCRFNSNVWQRKVPVSAFRQSARPSAPEFTRSSVNLWWSLPLLHSFGCRSATSKPCLHVSASPRERGASVTAAVHLHPPPPWLARERAKVAPAALCLQRHHRGALPNPSLKRSANGRPPGPV